MFRPFASLTALALMLAPATLPLFANAAQAQAPAQKPSNSEAAATAISVNVVNILGLERRVAGGHKAKVRYAVNLPEGFQLTRIEGDITFKLSDGKTQTGSYNANTNKTNDTIEIAANGAILGVDQEPTAVTARITAFAEKAVKGSAKASFRIDGTLISQQDEAQPPDVDILKISDFKRQALGGHQVRVHFKANNPPAGFDPTQLKVTALFKLDGNKTQSNTVTQNNPSLTGAVLVDTDGKVVSRDGEAKQIDTRVEISGKIAKRGADTRIETCGGGECKR